MAGCPANRALSTRTRAAPRVRFCTHARSCAVTGCAASADAGRPRSVSTCCPSVAAAKFVALATRVKLAAVIRCGRGTVPWAPRTGGDTGVSRGPRAEAAMEGAALGALATERLAAEPAEEVTWLPGPMTRLRP